MLRRLATSLAATSALVLTATAPALADHGDPEPIATLPGNVKTCEGDVADALEQEGYEAEFFWEKSKDVTSDEDVIKHNWWTVTITDDLQFLTVDDHSVPEGDFLVVLVKGGNATNVFVGPDLDDLYAPTNASGGHAQISNYTICKFKGEKTPDPDTSESPDPDTSESPDPDTSESPDPDTSESPDPETTGTPEPETSKSPAPVPTAVPAGASGTGDGSSMAPVGVAAAAVMALAGTAALLRRRFAHQS